MKKFLSVLLLLFSLSSFNLQEGKSTVTIEIDGLRNSEGTVRIGVYNDADKFPDDGGTVRNLSGAVNNGSCTIKTKDLPYGKYAFALLHDENDNGEMDFSWVGVPQEGFGFSNNPSIGLSAPSFDEAKVDINSSSSTIKIKVKYM